MTTVLRIQELIAHTRTMRTCVCVRTCAHDVVRCPTDMRLGLTTAQTHARVFSVMSFIRADNHMCVLQSYYVHLALVCSTALRVRVRALEHVTCSMTTPNAARKKSLSVPNYLLIKQRLAVRITITGHILHKKTCKANKKQTHGKKRAANA